MWQQERNELQVNPEIKFATAFKLCDGYIQFIVCLYSAYLYLYNTTLLPSVNTLIARGMLCGAKYTHHTFTPIIKHLITTTANIKKYKKSW